MLLEYCSAYHFATVRYWIASLYDIVVSMDIMALGLGIPRVSYTNLILSMVG